MKYIIGGNYRIALDYGKRHLDLWPGCHNVRFYSVTQIAQGPALRGIQFHPGDKVYQVGMIFATGKELRQCEEELDICTMGLAVKVEVQSTNHGVHDVLVLTMLSKLDAEISEEMREIEELRRKLIEQQ